MNNTINKNIFDSPKQNPADIVGRSSWYPYYAGFPTRFVSTAIEMTSLDKSACILDPWNGSGTTTSTANSLGFSTIGVDINPVMMVVAKGRRLSQRENTSLLPLANEIVNVACAKEIKRNIDQEPLSVWLKPQSAKVVRSLERSIRVILSDSHDPMPCISNTAIRSYSDLICFFYIALFRVVRNLLSNFYSSNPNWLKTPKNFSNRLLPSRRTIMDAFLNNVEAMVTADKLTDFQVQTDSNISLLHGSSENIPVGDELIDLVITSPPYCTRIDYAVATLGELSVLGFSRKEHVNSLRRKMIGSSTVPKNFIDPEEDWGPTCNDFLNRVKNHNTRASSVYYYKNHTQYFKSIYNSLKDISRTVKRDGEALFVVQDSYYKDIHNNLAAVFEEMLDSMDFELVSRQDFTQMRSMASRNPKVRIYRDSNETTESVIYFRKCRG